MTKKDYELFANEVFVMFQGEASDKNGNSRIDLVNFLSRVFKQDNCMFQPDKFERACYEGKHIRKSISGKV